MHVLNSALQKQQLYKEVSYSLFGIFTSKDNKYKDLADFRADDFDISILYSTFVELILNL